MKKLYFIFGFLLLLPGLAHAQVSATTTYSAALGAAAGPVGQQALPALVVTWCGGYVQPVTSACPLYVSGGGGGAGTASSVTLLAGTASVGTVGLNAGTNAIGSVSVSNFPSSQAVTGTFWQSTQPISAAALPLPSGASTSTNQSTIIGDLTTINTTLASPFQAGGSIGNTSFGATQSVAANLNDTDASDATAGAATGTQIGSVTMAQVLSSTPSFTTGTLNYLTMSSAGNLRTQLYNGIASAMQNFSSGATASNGAIGVAGVYSSTLPTLTSGQSTGLQLNSSGLLLTNDAGNYAQASTSSGQSGPLVQCGATSSSPTYTTGQSDPLSCNTSGGLRVQNFGTYTSTPAALASNASGGIALDTASDQIVDPEVQKPTYSISYNVSPGASGIFATLCGSATKTVRIHNEIASAYATTAGGVVLNEIKTSTAPSGGTSGGTVSSGPNDSNSAAMTETATGYTTAPTGGTAIVTYFDAVLSMPLISTAGNLPIQIVHGNGDQAIVLRGTTQCIEYSTSGTLATGADILLTIATTEE